MLEKFNKYNKIQNSIIENIKNKYQSMVIYHRFVLSYIFNFNFFIIIR